jgi:hypothetical protein
MVDSFHISGNPWTRDLRLPYQVNYSYYNRRTIMPEATQQDQKPSDRPAAQGKVKMVSREEFEKKHPDHKVAREKAEKQEKSE